MFIVLITKSYDKSVWCNFSVHCLSFIAKYGFLGYRRNMDYDEDYAPIKHSFGLNLTSEDLSIGFHYAF